MKTAITSQARETIITGVLRCSLDDLYDALETISGRRPHTHELPAAMKEAKRIIKNTDRGVK